MILRYIHIIIWSLLVSTLPLPISVKAKPVSSFLAADTIVYESFDRMQDVQISDIDFWNEPITGAYDRRRVIQLSEGKQDGSASFIFYEPSARYDVVVYYVENRNMGSSLTLKINGEPVDSIRFGNSRSFRKKVIEGVSILRYSEVELVFYGGQNEKVRLEKVLFVPSGNYEGNLNNLEEPLSLRLYKTSSERIRAKQMFPAWVDSQLRVVKKRRMQELKALTTPFEWQKRQQKIRQSLPLYFGEFPDKTPLNARTTGIIEKEKYSIEKVIYESRQGYYVTANLYVPKGRDFPLPAVVFPCGHSDDGKAQASYHSTGIGLALKGYVVLIYDPIGQGERSEYYNPQLKENEIHNGVDQHWYVGRQAFLTGQTLSGLRLWDGIRSVDYLLSRPEVDGNKLAAAGNSGGGQMALLLTAVDERIQVCAAAHPGGPMENAYLMGCGSPGIIDKEIYSLIPPRPVRIIVGDTSGEETRHMEKIMDMAHFYQGLQAPDDRYELKIVPGAHNMALEKREAAYEWLNRWFGNEEEGNTEPELQTETVQDLWCTPDGNVLQLPNARASRQILDEYAGKIYFPSENQLELKNNIISRTGFSYPDFAGMKISHPIETIRHEGMFIEKGLLDVKNGIAIPMLLFNPDNTDSSKIIYLHVSDKGKPDSFDQQGLPVILASEGATVVSIDVRGTGETSAVPEFHTTRLTGHTPLLRINSELAMHSTTFGKTVTGMRAEDVLHVVNYLESRYGKDEMRIIAIGEGAGGLWASLAAALDNRISGVVTLNMLLSYRSLAGAEYYEDAWEYFWVPGALRVYDIPDVINLISPRRQWCINPAGLENGDDPGIGISAALKNDPYFKIIISKDIPEAFIVRQMYESFVQKPNNNKNH